MLLATKVFYYFAQNLTYVLFFTAVFKKERKFSPLHKLVQIILLTSTQIICSIFMKPTLLSVVMIAVFYLSSQIKYRQPIKSLAIEAAFAYAAREVLRVVYSVPTMFICISIFQTKGALLNYVVSGTFLLVTCCCSIPFLRKLDLSELGEKYSVGVFALVLILILGALNRVQVSYDPVSREFFISTFFALIICFGILVFWAKDGKDKARLSKRLKKVEAINHELGGQIPVMERRLKKLVAQARELNTVGRFAAEAAQEYDMFSTVCEGLVGTAEQVNADTGIPVLDSIVRYAAGTARENGVLFECEVMSKLKPLLKQHAVTTDSLQQLLRNLLDNAVHAAAKSEREPRMVQCMMGLAGDAYRIDVYDSGDPFPPNILRDLGRMGNTTDGHGIGMVNVLEVLAQCGASIFITHYEKPKGTGATKCVTISFDGKAMAHLPDGSGGEPSAIGISSLLIKNRN